ncbi:hypothetical protein RHECNPAF_1760025 [Rhizobium etli CNPAF512]|nr:hypothetical protein RHECNPAF_1760025 [Rhizobium etli CNPAF512]
MGVRGRKARFETARRVDRRAQHLGDLVEHHDRQIEFDDREQPVGRFLDRLGGGAEQVLHQRDDETIAAGKRDVLRPVAQRRIDEGDIGAEIIDQVVLVADLAAEIIDRNVEAGLAFDDIGKELAVDLSEGAADLGHAASVAKPACQLGEKGGVHCRFVMRSIAHGHLSRLVFAAWVHHFLFDGVDGRTLVSRDRLAAVFESDLRHRTVHVGQQGLLDDHVEAVLLVADDLDLGDQRRADAVGQQDAEEGADQRRADQVAEHFGRIVDVGHRLDDAENGRDDTDRREGIAHDLDRVVGLHLVVHDGVELFIHQRLDFVAARVADDDQADIIADEGRQLLVLQNRGCLLEDRRFGRIVDMGFDFVSRLGAQVTHQRIEHAERIEIIALLRHGVLEGFAERLAGILHHLHRIGHDEAAEAGAADDDEFEGLEQSLHVAAHRHEAADDTAASHYKSDNDVHRQPNLNVAFL